MSEAFKGNSRLLPALRVSNLASRKCSLAAALCAASICEERRARLNFSDQDVKSSREPVIACGSHQYAEERVVRCQDEVTFWRSVKSMHQDELSAAFYEGKASETSYHGYGILT